MCDDFRMGSRIQAVVLPSEPTEFREELRRIFQELNRFTSDDALNGECAPALDGLESDEAVEITMDLPGVPLDAVRVVAKRPTILIAGRKAPRRARTDASFHLVERGYGRFARAVRVAAACDTSRATAGLRCGERRITIPRIKERRGRQVRIAISGESPAS